MKAITQMSCHTTIAPLTQQSRTDSQIEHLSHFAVVTDLIFTTKNNNNTNKLNLEDDNQT